MSNAKDGMICVRGDFGVTRIDTPQKFGVICRSNERIWGTDIDNEPDTMLYSKAMDPTDWTYYDPDTPEQNAGDLKQPSWDGDSFHSMAQFGSYLIAFKRNRVWRILGADPGEYTCTEQYGGGTEYPRTIAIAKTYVYMLSDRGILAYNGETVAPFNQEYCTKVWERMNKDALSEAYGCMFQDRYYLALPLDGSSVNNAVLIYNTLDGTFLLREGITV